MSSILRSDIDVVITWVDGDDPVHRQKRLSCLPPGLDKHAKPAGDTRYADRGELGFCVSSILKHCDWVNRIFIVTDAQEPPWYGQLTDQQKARIRIVDHKVIFRGYEELLPTFNSLSIETMLWRIPDLSERFIYFNDDLVVLRPMKEANFFDGDRVCLRGHWEKNRRIQLFFKNLKARVRKSKVTHRSAQLQGARLAVPDAERLFVTGHIPQPLRKSTFEKVFNLHRFRWEENARPRFRRPGQFWPIGYVQNYEAQHNEAHILTDESLLYLSPSRMSTDDLIRKIEQSEAGSPSFLCMQSLDQADSRFYEYWVKCMFTKVGCMP